MKVCKFEKMKEEDEIRQVINYILKEHPYVVVVPTLTQLQEWLQDISISWFHEEDSASHTTINNIEEYCRTLADHLIHLPQLFYSQPYAPSNRIFNEHLPQQSPRFVFSVFIFKKEFRVLICLKYFH